LEGFVVAACGCARVADCQTNIATQSTPANLDIRLLCSALVADVNWCMLVYLNAARFTLQNIGC
jgi:hypothetical protein